MTRIWRIQASLIAVVAAFGMGLLNPVMAFPQKAKKVITSYPTPNSCALNVELIASHTGSKPYLRLWFVIQALSSAQESVKFLSQSVEDIQTSTSLTTALAAFLTGADQSIDALHCAAAIMNKYSATNEDDENMRQILVSAFNREADVIADIKSHAKARFLHASEGQTAASILQDAERMSANIAIQNQAASDILVVAAYAFMLSVDLSDPNAKTTEYLSVTCDEYADLLKENAQLAQAEKSAFSDASGLIDDGLKGHKCRQ